ncbi:MAG: ATP-binding protein [Chitinispirillaceae bacterium]|nr:ATP-binding protein [Chitinispirillaceae bacterium]
MWGSRQTGKTTLLKQLFPGARYYDLLLSEVYHKLLLHPGQIREELIASDINGESRKFPVIIDEIQKLPALLDEVHWLIENRRIRFVLCGSSARKLKRTPANLLGGRAVRYELFPLVFPEIDNFDIIRALNYGLLPRHYQSASPLRLLQSYVGDYLQQEITAESITRNIPAFGRFLEVAALGNGELLNYTNIAADCGVSAPTVKEYYRILEDTLIGTQVVPYRIRSKRRIIQAPKFYFFDIGIVGYLTRRGAVQEGSELFGRAFEHFIYLEILAHAAYSEKFYPITYWRTSSGFEVDFILGSHEVAVEVKSSQQIRPRHLSGMRAFREEFSPAKSIIVSMDDAPRTIEDNIEILPWRVFLEQLWGDELI